jgi:hypothetical protein
MAAKKVVADSEESERQKEADAKARAMEYEKTRAMGASMKRTPDDPFGLDDGLASADQSLPPIGGSSLPSIGKGGRGNFMVDDEYMKKINREMNAFDNIGKKDNWSDPHANASMAQMMKERKDAAAAKREEELRVKMQEQAAK